MVEVPLLNVKSGYFSMNFLKKKEKTMRIEKAVLVARDELVTHLF